MARNYDLKPEDKFILNCSVTKISDDEIKNIDNLINMDLDWDYLLQTAIRHRLNYLFYWQLERLYPKKVPDDVKEKLQGDFHNNVRRNLAMFKELVKIIDLLQQHGVELIPYKGPVLAIMTYENLGFRRFGDLDFYVHWEDVPLTKKILIENGYEPLMKLTSNQEKAFYKLQREYQFRNKSSNVVIEIQWKFISNIFSIDESLLLNHNPWENVYLDQKKLKTVSSELLILILCIHNASHFFSSLFRFQDIYEIMASEKTIKWGYIVEKAEQIDAKRILLVNLYIIKQLYGIKLPKEISEEIENNIIVNKLSKHIISVILNDRTSWGIIEKVILQHNLREHLNTKIKTIINLIFWPTPDVIQSVSLPKILEPCYYFIQFLRMLRKIILNNY